MSRPWREWLPAVLCLGSPCLTAAVTAAGAVMASAFLPQGSPWTIPVLRAVVVANVVLAVGGAAAEGLLLHGTASGRVGRSVACGLGGLILHLVALLPLTRRYVHSNPHPAKDRVLTSRIGFGDGTCRSPVSGVLSSVLPPRCSPLLFRLPVGGRVG